MSTLTTIWQLIKPASTDQVRDLDDQLRTLVDRLDYLLGETGTWSSPSAAGSSNALINLSRPYPNGFRVFLGPESGATAGSADFFWWTTSRNGTGGPGGVGQFQINVNMSVAAVRTVAYMVRPLP